MTKWTGSRSKLALVSVLLVFPLIWLWGCSSDPVGPGTDSADIDEVVDYISSVPLGPKTSSDPAEPVSVAGDGNDSDSDNVGLTIVSDGVVQIEAEEGAQLALPDVGSGSYFLVPENSIDEDRFGEDIELKVEVSSEANSACKLHQFEFGPHGLEFDSRNPAQLVINAEALQDEFGCVPGKLVWVYYNPNTGNWDLEQVVRVSSDGHFYIPIYHFSYYRMGALDFGLSQGGQ